MKVAYVNNQLSLGGAETVMHQLRNGMGSAGISTQMYIAEGKTLPHDVDALYPRILSRLYYSRLNAATEALWPRRYWTNRAFRRIADSDSDIVHIHNFHGNYSDIESLAYLASRKKVVWTFHAFWGITGGCDHPMDCTRYQEHCGSCPQLGKWPIGPEDNTARELESKLKYLSNAPLIVVAPSRHLAKRVSESKVGKAWNVVYIPNGVDTTRFSFERKVDPVFRARFDIGAGKTSVLVANRNFKDPDKGFPIIRDALLRIERANIHLLLAGEHSDWAAQQLPTDLTFTDMGYVSSRETMAELYEAADIFLFASAAENFPCVILEAMSSKCCVVATPTSGVTEQISTGETGFLADDISAEALAKSLEKAVRSSELLSLYGDQARTRVNKCFSEDLMVRRHLELYDMIVRT